MLKLVLKDILIQKKTIIYTIPYAVFALFIFTHSFSVRGSYMVSIISIAYLFIIYSNSYDEKNKCYMTLSSLPIKRRDIVAAKYLSVILFTIVGIAVTGLIGMIISAFNTAVNIRLINAGDILWALLSTLLMYSIYYPLYFKYGQEKLRIVNIILYMAFIFGPNLLVSAASENSTGYRYIAKILENPLNLSIYTFTVLGLLLVFLCSQFISMNIFETKDI